MIEKWDKDTINELHQLDIDEWFDVYNNGLVEDRGFSLLSPEILSIRKNIKSDYEEYLYNCVNDSNFHSYYVFKNEDGKIVSICRIVRIGHDYYFEGLETHRNYYNKGFALKLVNNVIQTLLREDIKAICSQVRNLNIASINFHNNLGFVVSDVNETDTTFKLDIESYLRKTLFNDWASTYNQSVHKSDKENTYPFAGYSKIQNYIFDRCKEIPNARILEMGIGTGLMTWKLYGLEYDITGVDISKEMIKQAKLIMPLNKYVLSDFKSVNLKMDNQKYNVIIFSYSIHHMKPVNQKYLLDVLSSKLEDNGIIIIGDVMTRGNEEMKKLSVEVGKYWDDEEYYPTLESYNNQVLKQHYDISFDKVSFCGGIIELKKKR